MWKGGRCEAPLALKEQFGTLPSRTVLCAIPRHSLHAIYAYVDPPNHPNVGDMPYMECLGYLCQVSWNAPINMVMVVAL